MPPAALISSAAICAACGIDEPATDCASAITPILIGGLVCAAAGAASARASAAAPPARMVSSGVAPGLTGRYMLGGSLGMYLRRVEGAAAWSRSLANGACPTSPTKGADHAGLRPDCRRLGGQLRAHVCAAAQHAVGN